MKNIRKTVGVAPKFAPISDAPERSNVIDRLPAFVILVTIGITLFWDYPYIMTVWIIMNLFFLLKDKLEDFVIAWKIKKRNENLNNRHN